MSSQDDAGSRDLAERESVAYAAGTLEDIEKQNQHARREEFRKHFGYAVIFLLWFSFTVVLIAGINWSYHLLAPESWHFLAPSQVDRIQNILFGSVISGLFAVMSKNKYF